MRFATEMGTSLSATAAGTRNFMGSATAPAIPAHLDEIDLQWMRSVLAHANDLDPDQLRGLRTELLGKGQGLSGQIVRLHLDWEAASAGPAALVAKLRSADDQLAALSKAAYECEYLFY